MGIFDVGIKNIFLTLFSFSSSVNPALLKMVKDLQKEVDELKDELWKKKEIYLREKLKLEFEIKVLKKENKKLRKKN